MILTEEQRALRDLYNADCNHHAVLKAEETPHADHRERLADSANRLRDAYSVALELGKRIAKEAV